MWLGTDGINSNQSWVRLKENIKKTPRKPFQTSIQNTIFFKDHEENVVEMILWSKLGWDGGVVVVISAAKRRRRRELDGYEGWWDLHVKKTLKMKNGECWCTKREGVRFWGLQGCILFYFFCKKNISIKCMINIRVGVDYVS